MARHRKVIGHGLILIVLASIPSVANAQGPPTQTFKSKKFGLSIEAPKPWKVDEQHPSSWEFAFLIPQPGQEEVSLVSCRVWIAESNLEACRAALVAEERELDRIDPARKIDARIVVNRQGRRLDVLRQFLKDGAVDGRQRHVSMIANRQRYELSLWAVDEKRWAELNAAFDAMLDTLKFTPPDTGAVLVDQARNRWVYNDHHVAIDMPTGWAPVLNPVEGDHLWATGPADGAVWPNNYLKVSRTRGNLDVHKLARTRRDELEYGSDPPHKVLKCAVVKQGQTDALESVFAIFSTTTFERKFHVDGFNYEVSFTIETRRVAELSPVIRKCLDSFNRMSAPSIAPTTRAAKLTVPPKTSFSSTQNDARASFARKSAYRP
jgi:hypothetical protein